MIKHITQPRDKLVTVNGQKIWVSCTKCIFAGMEDCEEFALLLVKNGYEDCNEIENGYYIYEAKIEEMHFYNWEEVNKYEDKIYDHNLFPNCIECSDGENWLVMKSQRNFFHKGNCSSAPFSGASRPTFISENEYFKRVSRRVERYKKYEQNMNGNIKCSCGENATGVRYELFHNENTLVDTSPSCGTHDIQDLLNGRKVGFISGDSSMVQSEVRKFLEKTNEGGK